MRRSWLRPQAARRARSRDRTRARCFSIDRSCRRSVRSCRLMPACTRCRSTTGWKHSSTVLPLFSIARSGAATRPAPSPPGRFVRASAIAFRPVVGTSADSPGTNGISPSTPATRLTGSCATGVAGPGPARRDCAELEEYRRAESEGAASRLTVFGNMVESLSADGNAPAVIALESQWNRLTHDLPFVTICGYAASCFHDGVPGLWSGACAEHGV